MKISFSRHLFSGIGLFLLTLWLALLTGMARIMRFVLSFMNTQRMELEVHSPVPV